MAIIRISMDNFKPFGNRAELELSPITVLIGANSSGKSSVIHALAALKQTAMRKTAGRALILDGPDVLVSLGRYVDAVHGHDYKRQIGLGVTFTSRISRITESGAGSVYTDPIHYSWRFRGTKKTQRIQLASRTTIVEDVRYAIRSKERGTKYEATLDGRAANALVTEVQNIGFRVRPYVRGRADFSEVYQWETLNQADEALLKELEKVRYLGPFREPPRRLYPYHGPVLDVGRSGAQAVPMLISELTASSRKRPGRDRVEGWLKTLGLARGLELKRQGASDSFRLGIVPANSDVDVTPADVGYGISQVLPVLVQGAYAEAGDTLVFEQPELHLHPAAQRGLGQFFVDTAKRTRGRILIETHSRNLVVAFQRAVRDGAMDPDWLKVVLVRRGDACPSLTAYAGDDAGDLWDEWDAAFPEQWDAGPLAQ